MFTMRTASRAAFMASTLRPSPLRKFPSTNQLRQKTTKLEASSLVSKGIEAKDSSAELKLPDQKVVDPGTKGSESTEGKSTDGKSTDEKPTDDKSKENKDDKWQPKYKYPLPYPVKHPGRFLGAVFGGILLLHLMSRKFEAVDELGLYLEDHPPPPGGGAKWFSETAYQYASFFPFGYIHVGKLSENLSRLPYNEEISGHGIDMIANEAYKELKKIKVTRSDMKSLVKAWHIIERYGVQMMYYQEGGERRKQVEKWRMRLEGFQPYIRKCPELGDIIDENAHLLMPVDPDRLLAVVKDAARSVKGPLKPAVPSIPKLGTKRDRIMRPFILREFVENEKWEVRRREEEEAEEQERREATMRAEEMARQKADRDAKKQVVPSIDDTAPCPLFHEYPDNARVGDFSLACTITKIIKADGGKKDQPPSMGDEKADNETENGRKD